MKITKHRQYIKSFPYYKVQFWDTYVSAWHDIQRRFKTIREARTFGRTLGKKWRVMRVHRAHREVV